jgi:uncharacterized membrane protein YkoI
VRDKLKGIIIAAGAIAALGVGGAAIAGAASGGEDGAGGDKGISGPALDKASASALKATGGGKVTGSEVGDEESYYEIEVTLDSGAQVDVQLDQNFTVVSTSSDEK